MSVPDWLQQRLAAAGGSVSFRRYMEWVLHDPVFGAYGSGQLRIGPTGDFTTAPSLGPDFAALLAPQIAAWFEELAANTSRSTPLALIETGPGEGTLAADLAVQLVSGWPELAKRITLVLVEPNPGMAARQQRQLATSALPCRWVSLEQLAQSPPVGIMLAHEVLDALPVDRIIWDGSCWRRQEVTLAADDSDEITLRLSPGPALDCEALVALETMGLGSEAEQRPAGWSTELHPALLPWMASAAKGLRTGVLLVVDYALEAWRYYAPSRSSGTLLAYKGQQLNADPLQAPGESDLTAHLCIESLLQAAQASGWTLLGHCKQGQALLALGLAERLHALQHGNGRPLADRLASREALLRLVDPHALGDFRWLAFSRGETLLLPRFLQNP